MAVLLGVHVPDYKHIFQAPQAPEAQWAGGSRVAAIADARMPPEQFTHYKARLLVNDTNLNGPELVEPLES